MPETRALKLPNRVANIHLQQLLRGLLVVLGLRILHGYPYCGDGRGAGHILQATRDGRPDRCCIVVSPRQKIRHMVNLKEEGHVQSHTAVWPTRTTTPFTLHTVQGEQRVTRAAKEGQWRCFRLVKPCFHDVSCPWQAKQRITQLGAACSQEVVWLTWNRHLGSCCAQGVTQRRGFA